MNATILTEGWSYRVSTEPLVIAAWLFRAGEWWKAAGSVLCRRGAGRDAACSARPGGRSLSMASAIDGEQGERATQSESCVDMSRLQVTDGTEELVVRKSFSSAI